MSAGGTAPPAPAVETVETTQVVDGSQQDSVVEVAPPDSRNVPEAPQLVRLGGFFYFSVFSKL